MKYKRSTANYSPKANSASLRSLVLCETRENQPIIIDYTYRRS